MPKLSIAEIEEIEQRREEAMLAHVGEGDCMEYALLVEMDLPRLIADNKRLRQALNQLSGLATSAVS